MTNTRRTYSTENGWMRNRMLLGFAVAVTLVAGPVLYQVTVAPEILQPSSAARVLLESKNMAKIQSGLRSLNLRILAAESGQPLTQQDADLEGLEVAGAMMLLGVARLPSEDLERLYQIQTAVWDSIPTICDSDQDRRIVFWAGLSQRPDVEIEDYFRIFGDAAVAQVAGVDSSPPPDRIGLEQLALEIYSGLPLVDQIAVERGQALPQGLLSPEQVITGCRSFKALIDGAKALAADRRDRFLRDLIRTEISLVRPYISSRRN